jgi:hypothetical protein
LNLFLISLKSNFQSFFLGRKLYYKKESIGLDVRFHLFVYQKSSASFCKFRLELLSFSQITCKLPSVFPSYQLDQEANSREQQLVWLLLSLFSFNIGPKTVQPVVSKKTISGDYVLMLSSTTLNKPCLSLHVLLALRLKYVINFSIAQTVISFNEINLLRRMEVCPLFI